MFRGRILRTDENLERRADEAAERSMQSGAGNPAGELRHDFTRVRIHDDTESHAIAASYGARALTVGSDIYFGRGELNPQSERGRRLIAHEVAHAGQGGASGEIHRKVTDQYAALKKSIESKEPHEALQVLQDLGERDFDDTVSAMDKDGLINLLFENVDEKDSFAFATTLQRVQNRRHWAVITKDKIGEVIDSCKPDQREKIRESQAKAVQWINDARTALKNYIALPLSKLTHVTAASLYQNFHSLNLDVARLIESRLGTVASGLENPPIPFECAAPSDPSCKTYHAYYRRSESVIRWCVDNFFSLDPDLQTYGLIHESSHAFLFRLEPETTTPVTDLGYTSERVYSRLKPEEALINADSYARLVADLGGRIPLTFVPPADTFARRCRRAKREIKTALARAQQINTATTNVTADHTLDFQSKWADLRQTHVKNNDPNLALQMDRAYQTVYKAFAKPIAVTCDDGGLVFPAEFDRRGLHITTKFATLSEEAQIEAVYAAALRFFGGVSAKDAPGYVAVARGIKERTPSWTPEELIVPPALPELAESAAIG